MQLPIASNDPAYGCQKKLLGPKSSKEKINTSRIAVIVFFVNLITLQLIYSCYCFCKMIIKHNTQKGGKKNGRKSQRSQRGSDRGVQLDQSTTERRQPKVSSFRLGLNPNQLQLPQDMFKKQIRPFLSVAGDEEQSPNDSIEKNIERAIEITEQKLEDFADQERQQGLDRGKRVLEDMRRRANGTRRRLTVSKSGIIQTKVDNRRFRLNYVRSNNRRVFELDLKGDKEGDLDPRI